MDSAEFADWQLEYRLEPWGEVRGDLRSGMAAAQLANLVMTLRDTMIALQVKGWHRGHHEPYRPDDFMPDFSYKPMPMSAPARQIQSAAQLQAFFLSLTQETGGTIH